MVDSQTLQALQEACSQSGCPICTMVEQTVERYLTSLFYERLLDPTTRRQLRASLGLCSKHARMTLDDGLGDALGFAILYEDFFATILEGAAKSRPSRGRRKEMIRSIEASQPCPACRVNDEIETRAVEAVEGLSRNEELFRLLKKSNGFCLPHLSHLLRRTAGRQQTELILDLQWSKMEALRLELGEFIRKNDYRFRNESFDSERDAYRRAIEMVTGEKMRKPEK